MERPILQYFGGKFAMADWIIKHMPRHEVYIEPFGGAASVLLVKKPCRCEVYNDVDNEIVNVFQVAKNQGKELLRQLKLTPYSRSVYLEACQSHPFPGIEGALNTIIKSSMGIGDSIHNSSGFRCSKTSGSSPAKTFKGYVDYFEFFTERLRSVIIENLPYEEIFKKYDSEKSLFYVDPPYVFDTRSKKHTYGHELDDENHTELLDLMATLKGNAMLSGYDHGLYKNLPWRSFQLNASTQKGKRVETLWVKEPNSQQSFF